MTHPTRTPAPTPAIATTTAIAPAVVEPALVDGVDVDAVARAVRACAGVADLYSGRFGEIGSYLPGRRVVGGVQVDAGSVTVHVRARWGYSPSDLHAQTAAVTAPLRNGRRLNLVIDDIDDDLTGSADSTVNAATAVAPPLAIESPANTSPAVINPPLPESSTS